MQKFWDIAGKILVPLVFILGATLVGHEVRIAKMEGNRFTSQDWHEHAETIYGELADIKERLGGLPPGALLERVARLEATITALTGRIAELIAEVREMRRKQQ